MENQSSGHEKDKPSPLDKTGVLPESERAKLKGTDESQKGMRSYLNVQDAEKAKLEDPNRIERGTATKTSGRLQLEDNGKVLIKGALSDAAELKQKKMDKTGLAGQKAGENLSARPYTKEQIQEASSGDIAKASQFVKGLQAIGADGKIDADATSRLRAQAAIDLVGEREVTTNGGAKGFWQLRKNITNSIQDNFLRGNMDPAEAGWALRGGKCYELGHAVGAILEGAGEKDVHVIMVADPKDDMSNHCFTVMNIGKGADVRDPKTWSANAIAPDAWGADLKQKEPTAGPQAIHAKFAGRPVVYHNGNYISGMAVKMPGRWNSKEEIAD